MSGELKQGLVIRKDRGRYNVSIGTTVVVCTISSLLGSVCFIRCATQRRWGITGCSVSKTSRSLTRLPSGIRSPLWLLAMGLA